MGYLKESIVLDFLKTMLVGSVVTLVSLVALIVVVFGGLVALLNFPKTFMLIGFIIFSIGVGYDIRRPKLWRLKL